MGKLVIPSVSKSELPGLLGLAALRKNRAILDFSTLELYFCGPGEYELGKAMPPGTDVFQLEVAPSGHLVLPCCNYSPGAATSSVEHTLTLISKVKQVPPAPNRPPQTLPAATANIPPPPGFDSIA